jgi:Ca2+-transporting ATPase
MESLSDRELSERIRRVNIFARVVPEQKLRLVNAFKANGEIVSMTGDGVNDAPALKAANIGIAMGGRGTDVAREAAALVLLDDDFSSIVKAIRLGRRIFDNLRKAMAYILAVHVPIAGLSLIPVLLGLPMVLMPVHVVFLELIIDPACSIAFEAERPEPDVMRRPPRERKEPLFSVRTIALSLLQGAAVLLVAFFIYWWELSQGRGELLARAMAFTTLVLANLGLILSNRFWSMNIIAALRFANKALFIIIFATFFVLGLVLYVPSLRDLFHFDFLHLDDIFICIGAAGICIIWFEIVKLFGRRKKV